MLSSSGGASTKLIDAQALAAMKPSGFFINIARGGVMVNEDALISALQAGQIAGAGLDVFVKKPLVKTLIPTMLRRLVRVVTPSLYA